MNADEKLQQVAEARKKIKAEMDKVDADERGAKEQQRIEKEIEKKLPKEEREAWEKVKVEITTLSEKSRDAKKRKVELEGKMSERLTDEEVSMLFGAVKKKSNGEPKTGTKNQEVLDLIKGGMTKTKDLDDATGRSIHGQIYALINSGKIENIGPGEHRAI